MPSSIWHKPDDRDFTGSCLPTASYYEQCASQSPSAQHACLGINLGIHRDVLLGTISVTKYRLQEDSMLAPI